MEALALFGDETLSAAANTWLLREEWMPTIAGIVAQCEDEARALARSLNDVSHVLPPGPRNDEPLADAHAWAETIRAATGLVWRDPTEKPRGGDDLTRGHDHRRGADHCRVCSAQRRVDAAQREFVPPAPAWSACRECDGTHFVETDRSRNEVRPCESCNGFSYALWLGGHMEPGHRCEECGPSGRRRRTEDS